MSEYLPFSNLERHELDFLAIRSQGRHNSGLDAARGLIRQCRIVRYRRALELQQTKLDAAKAEAAREEELQRVMEGASKELPMTPAELAVMQADVITMPTPEPIEPEPLAA